MVLIYDCHYFIIKELAEEFKGQFECLGEITEKYITFSVPKKEFGNGKTVLYKIKFINGVSFMRSSLSNLANSLAEGLHECKYTACVFDLEYMAVKYNILNLNF